MISKLYHGITHLLSNRQPPSATFKPRYLSQKRADLPQHFGSFFSQFKRISINEDYDYIHFGLILFQI